MSNREHLDRRMPADTADWLRSLIGGHAERSDDHLRRRIDAIEKILGLRHRARVLDLGCGSGRQTVELAKRHYRVVGMDLSAAALAPARQAVKDQRLSIHFHAGDMRRIPFGEEFSAAVNLQNPIGCYPAEKDDLDCLKSVHKALKEDGRLLLDLVNREWLITRLAGSSGGRPIYDLRSGRLDCRGILEGRPRPASLGDTLRVYSLTEAVSLLERAGFVFKGVWGDFEQGAYGIQSERMLVLAEKAAAPKAPARKDDELASALRIKGRPR
ncbi:MAG TPA: class I SAM-dependent methyltransferase [Elusimicrobiota bacterium]|jgi:SAM-dependent methyltransferase|nr:class I SAM-dependent methyltransferase [Elusimicrobiota bacterium]